MASRTTIALAVLLISICAVSIDSKLHLSAAHFDQPIIRYAYADPIQNARTERIGNYEFQMTTQPKDPLQGTPTTLVFRVGTVDGTDLIDVPIVLRIADSDGNLIQKTNPIVLPSGHYSYQVTFDKPGRKTIYVDLTDNAYTGQTLTFTFFTNVASPFDFLYFLLPAVAAAVAALFVVRYIANRNKRLKNADAI